MIYLSARTAEFFDDPVHFGCMFNAIKQTGGQWMALEMGCQWMLDNGAFSNRFSEERWLRALSNPKFLAHRDTCIGVIVPDVVFDWLGTLARFERYVGVVRSYGYPVAIATQNGITPDSVPWSEIDVLFIGGDHQHKRVRVQPLVPEAKRRGIHVHVGRVNSGAAISQFYPWADSVDGSTFKYGDAAERRMKMETIRAGLNNRASFQWRLL